MLRPKLLKLQRFTLYAVQLYHVRKIYKILVTIVIKCFNSLEMHFLPKNFVIFWAIFVIISQLCNIFCNNSVLHTKNKIKF